MSGAMTHPHHHHHINWYIVVILLAVIAFIGTILALPYITTPKTAVIPVTGSQNTYAEYLLGEKVIYAMPATVSEALTTYHLGEKAFYADMTRPSEALTAYHLGEKYVMSNIDYALLTYHLGEKDY